MTSMRRVKSTQPSICASSTSSIELEDCNNSDTAPDQSRRRCFPELVGSSHSSHYHCPSSPSNSRPARRQVRFSSSASSLVEPSPSLPAPPATSSRSACQELLANTQQQQQQQQQEPHGGLFAPDPDANVLAWYTPAPLRVERPRQQAFSPQLVFGAATTPQRSAGSGLSLAGGDELKTAAAEAEARRDGDTSPPVPSSPPPSPTAAWLAAGHVPTPVQPCADGGAIARRLCRVRRVLRSLDRLAEQ